MGWKEGQGLGIHNQGIKEPISASQSTDKSRISYNYLLEDRPLNKRKILFQLGDILAPSKATNQHPCVEIYLQNKKVNALIDTGSMVTCISQEFWNEIRETEPKIPLLNLKAIQIWGAFSKKSKRVTQQIFLDMAIAGVRIKTCFLIINNLIRPCILGMDWLQENKCCLDLEKRIMQLKIGIDEITVPFILDEVDKEELSLLVEENNIVETYELLKQKTETANLNFEQKQELLELIKKYCSLFSNKPGLTDKYIHHIEMKDNEPFVKRSYPIPFTMRSAVEEKLKEMLELGVIKRASSPYSSPMTVVKKKDGSVRICLDARELNNRMIADVESPPPTEELLQQFNGCIYLTTIDLTASYWQIPLTEESKKYTAFVYNGRSYVFNVLPFGLKTAVASFS